MNKLLLLWQSDWFKVIVSLLFGAAIGVVFYPSKTITERETSKVKESYELKLREMQSTHTEQSLSIKEKMELQESQRAETETTLNRKVETLTQENRSLKQSSKKQKFKLIKPDGTIIEREMEESNSEEVSSVVTSIRDEFSQKVKTIEDRWKKVYTEHVSEMKKKFDQDIEKVRSEQKVVEKIVEKEKVVEVNKKKLRVEAGVSKQKEYALGYAHLSYPIVGPVFLGGGVSASGDKFGDARIGLGLEF